MVSCARAGAVRSRSVSGLERDGPILASAFEVLTRRLLRRGARYGELSVSQRG